jgi:hypothetical protein
LVAAVRLPLLGIPFERDEGEYAYIGWRLGHNELPYRDWVDQKPPAIFWVYRAAFALPLEPIRSAHLASLIFSAASSCAVFFLGRRFLSPFWAFAGAALFTLFSVDPMVLGTAANTELFMLLPLILSQIAFLKAAENQRRIGWMLLSGALSGLAIAFKQVATVNWLLLIALYPIFATPERRWRRTCLFAACFTAGLLAVAAVFAFYFWIHAGFGQLIANGFAHNVEYVHGLTWSARLKFCLRTFPLLARTETLLWIMAAVGFAALAGKGKWFALQAGWLVTSLIAVSASGYFFQHYFQQLLPPLTLAAVFGAQWLSGLRLWRKTSILPSFLCLLLALLPLKTLWPFWFNYTPAEAVTKIYPDEFFAQMPELARRLADITTPNQRVFIFGAEPEVLFYARRVSASRYIFLMPLYGPYRDAREKQAAAEDEIVRARPSAAAYLPGGLFFIEGSEHYFTDWSLSYLEQNFYADTLLIREEPNTVHIVPASLNAAPPKRLLGAILARKASSQ